MSTAGLMSMGFLLLTSSLWTWEGVSSDTALAVYLAALSFCALGLALAPGKKALFPVLCFAVLAALFPEAQALWPLMLYLALLSLPHFLPATLLLLSFVYASHVPNTALLLLLLLAALLFYKDEDSRQSRRAVYQRLDESKRQAMDQQVQLKALQRERETAVSLAIMKERNRIAHDIHDSVGHLLSRSILQVGAMELTCQDPDTCQGLSDLKASLGEAMTSVRRSVHNTRQDSLLTDEEIKNLISSFRFCPVTYQNHASSELSLAQKHVILSVLREALSNIMRHSNATHVAITLTENAKGFTLLIADNGSSKGASSEPGVGLSGMQERVLAIGGSFHLSQERGYRILITLPKEDSHESGSRG